MTCLALLISGLVPGGAGAGSFEADVAPLFEASCLKCHVGTETTPLDLTALGHDLADRETFRLRQRIFDRVREGEMPPPGALDEALRTGPRSETRTREIDYPKSPYLNRNSLGEYQRSSCRAAGRGCRRHAPLSNLYVTLLQAMGVETDQFGQSAGSLTWP